jgi:F-type H+-transporting ATPase subunit delta
MKTDLAAVAGQYADAILQLASESGADKTVLDNLKTINQVISQTSDLEIVLRHPSVNAQEKKQLIISIFGGKVHELTLRLLEMLTDRRRLDTLPALEREYEKLWRVKQNIVAGTLVYAEKPDAKTLQQIKEKLAKQLGKTLELDEKEDKSLIGGYVLQLGDQVIDGSLKGRLQTIEKALLSV